MASPQREFLGLFRAEFQHLTGQDVVWLGGQSDENTAGFLAPYPCRRSGGERAGERFELGDMTTTYAGWQIVIEFESRQLPLSNLLKYWPYLRGELSRRPERGLVVCHFSDWWSYATRRDLWEWTLTRMKADPDRTVQIVGRQFDHWGDDAAARDTSICEAVGWIQTVACGGA